VGYQLVPFIVFVVLIVRTGFRYGPRIPLIFTALLVLGRFTLPQMLGPFRFPLYVCLLAIVLALIDRFKSVRWNVM
jgi:hypothetical protein